MRGWTAQLPRQPQAARADVGGSVYYASMGGDEHESAAEHQVVFYRGPDGARHIQVLFRDESFWLPQKAMAGLFGVEVPAVHKHLKNIFESGELHQDSVVSVLETTAADGKRYKVKHYNLDAIIAVGYRISSYEATQFRIWATKTLKEYVIKGFVLDDERLKQGGRFGRDYFDELLERIREIRASERRFYQKITDIYALAVDYDKDAPITAEFFASVQNKLHWAITGQTAAEIVSASADAQKPHMGLTAWKHAPEGKVLKSDVAVAKNYLSEDHIKELNRLVSAYLDLAENRAERKIAMKMKDWSEFLASFLALSDYPILGDKGKVSAVEARLKAESEFARFRVRQDAQHVSDFDREVRRLQDKPNDDDEQ